MIIIRCVLWISWLSFSYYSRRQPKGLSYYVSNDSMLTYIVSQLKSIVLNRHSDTVMVTVTVEYWILLKNDTNFAVWTCAETGGGELEDWWISISMQKTIKQRVVKHPPFFRLIHQYFARSMMFVGYKVFYYYISDNYGYY